MKIDLISVPVFYGANKAGVEKGPQTLLQNGLTQLLNKNHLIDSSQLIEVLKTNEMGNDPTLKYLKQILNYNENLSQLVYESLNSGNFPFTIGGDHSLALGTLSGALKANPDTLVIWIDAHTDINTHLTTPSGHIHGMPIASALNLGHPLLRSLFTNYIEPHQILYIGVRSIDDGEIKLINELNIQYMTPQTFKMERLDSFLKDNPNVPVHCDLDIDVLDASLVPGTSTPVSDGFSINEVVSIVEYLRDTNRVTSLDFVEFNPDYDQDNLTLNTSLLLLNTFFNKENKT